MFGLTCAFEAMRALGGPLYQTISGLLIPLSALLSKVVLKRTFTKGQIGAIAVVICGLAVKAKDVGVNAPLSSPIPREILSGSCTPEAQ